LIPLASSCFLGAKEFLIDIWIIPARDVGPIEVFLSFAQLFAFENRCLTFLLLTHGSVIA
jgi:hypothetical protein